MNLSRHSKESLKDPNRPVHFFETVANCFFVIIIGIFSTLFLIFLNLAIIFFSPTYNQMILFTGIGAIFFTLSRRMLFRRHLHMFRNLNYGSFLASRKKLCVWIIWTFNFYLMICWFILILLGSTNGFGLKFPTSDSKEALIISTDRLTKITGLVLWLVHLFLILLIKLILHYWTRMFAFAHREFEKRRKSLQIVRSKAEA